MFLSQSIAVGESKVVLTGGADNMSQAPYAVRNVRFGAPLGASIAFEDTLWTGLIDTHCKLPMALTAEKLGAQFKVTREEVDDFSLRSQTLWKKGKHYIILSKHHTRVNFSYEINNSYSHSHVITFNYFHETLTLDPISNY